ncbi:MAG: AFG1/ZapE family ATPase, partial [Pseudomonadota bacterium]
MTPWERYQQDLSRDDFSHDEAQEAAVGALQDLYERLLQRREAHSGFAGR